MQSDGSTNLIMHLHLNFVHAFDTAVWIALFLTLLQLIQQARDYFLHVKQYYER
jgi:hypothetical protein